MASSVDEFGKRWEDTFYSDDDFTLLIPDPHLPGLLGLRGSSEECETQWRDYCHGSAFGGSRKASDRRAPDETRLSFEFQARVCGRDARLQISRSYAGQAWSVTVRWSPPDDWSGAARKQIGTDYQSRAEVAFGNSRWKPREKYRLPDGSAVLFSFADIVDVTSDKVFGESDEGRHGLILVTGRTASGKSQIARGLVWKAMRDKALPLQRPDQAPVKVSRRPHLVTFEDPIEEYFMDVEELLQSGSSQVIEDGRAIDYTPRQKFRDCDGLKEVLAGALRQTPTALYVGEIRTADEFAEVMEFAGTGHLVVATAHAGNLVESVGKVLDAVKAQDSASRARYVPRILAVVHMSLVECQVDRGGGEVSLAGLVPAIYRRTTRGVQNLVADGLFSLIPGFSKEEQEAKAMGSLGRQYLAGALSTRVFEKFSASPADPGLATLLASTYTPEEWGEISNWNRGARSRTLKGKRLARKALELDIYGQ